MKRFITPEQAAKMKFDDLIFRTGIDNAAEGQGRFLALGFTIIISESIPENQVWFISGDRVEKFIFRNVNKER